MIEYRATANEDISSLKEIWKDSFQDIQQGIDMFFNDIFPDCNSFVAVDNNTIIAMVYFLDSRINGNKVAYLYAAATKKEYRSQGIMRNLISYSLSKLSIWACVTLPADKSLYSFYGKLGFVPVNAKTVTLKRNELQQLAVQGESQEPVVKGYCGIRNAVLKENFLFWNNKHIDYAFKYAELYGGKVIKNNYGYCIMFKENNACIITELICKTSNLPYFINEILLNTLCDEFVIHLSENQQIFEGETVNYGMIKYMTDYKCDNVYLGLTLE